MSEQKRYTANNMKNAAKELSNLHPVDRMRIAAMLRQAADTEEELTALKDKSCPYALPGEGCSAEDRHFQRTVELERENAQLKARLEAVVKECDSVKCDEKIYVTIDTRTAAVDHNKDIDAILRIARGEGGTE